ncbi:MAG: hypothetical protein U1E93_00515 [Alphaproteobacteria bacterium]
MRYFFNVILSSGSVNDPEGTILFTEEAAQAEAKIVASELLWNFSEELTSGAVLEVVAEDGRRVMAMPLKSRQAAALCA